jgi:hypothetical protein
MGDPPTIATSLHPLPAWVGEGHVPLTCDCKGDASGRMSRPLAQHPVAKPRSILGAVDTRWALVPFSQSCKSPADAILSRRSLMWEPGKYLQKDLRSRGSRNSIRVSPDDQSSATRSAYPKVVPRDRRHARHRGPARCRWSRRLHAQGKSQLGMGMAVHNEEAM